MTIAFSVALVFFFAATGSASPPVVSVRVPEAVELVAGELVEARVSVAVAEGYHLQANPASEEYLVPTRLDLKTSGGVTVSRITYPPGKRYRLNGADKDLKTYDGNFEVGVLLKASTSARPGKRILQGRFHYQACDSKTCLFPTSVPLMLVIRVVPTQKAHQASDAKR